MDFPVVFNVQICYNTETITKKSSAWVSLGLLILKTRKILLLISPVPWSGTLGIVEQWLQLWKWEGGANHQSKFFDNSQELHLSIELACLSFGPAHHPFLMRQGKRSVLSLVWAQGSGTSPKRWYNVVFTSIDSSGLPWFESWLLDLLGIWHIRQVS